MKAELISQKLHDIGVWEPEKWKQVAYFRASSAIKNVASLEEAKTTKGIGAGIYKKIVEIEETGTCAKWEKYHSIYGDIITKDVKVKKSGNITRIPREDALKKVTPVVEVLRPFVSKIEICGSFRREKPTVADADLLVMTDDWDKLKLEFSKLATIKASGNSKIEGHLSDGFQIDMTLADLSWGTQLLHFTGSAEHNIQLRNIAKKMGYTLNQYCIARDNECHTFDTEEEVFTFLKIPFVKPIDR